MAICAVTGCDRQAKTREWCGKHYQRWWKTGDPLGVRNAVSDPVERFWPKVRKTATCWLWTEGTDGKGYGRFQAGTGRADARPVHAYVYAWELVNGPVPRGLELDHLCRVHACVRPDHLEAVTHAENIRRGLWGQMHPRRRVDQTQAGVPA